MRWLVVLSTAAAYVPPASFRSPALTRTPRWQAPPLESSSSSKPSLRRKVGQSFFFFGEGRRRRRSTRLEAASTPLPPEAAAATTPDWQRRFVPWASRGQPKEKGPSLKRWLALSAMGALAAVYGWTHFEGPLRALDEALGGSRVVGELLTPGARRDSLTLLLSTATVIPMAKALGLSPILGFLASGIALGPNGLGAVTQLHTTEALAELGVVFFLFEMGLELSVAKLVAMKQEIFGLGLAQFSATTVLLMIMLTGFMGAKAGFLVGGALALSSSAFVLQLLRDQDELSTTHGRAALGVLLLQDLAVVPLLVLTPLLAQQTATNVFVGALSWAFVKAIGAVLAVEFVFKGLLNAAFDRAARSRSQEAFLAVTLLAALGVSAFTASIGLSDTLGAFLAGIALSETRYSSKVEADVAPFRGMLLGLFFVTVGFSMDLAFLAKNPFLIFGLASGIVLVKALVLGVMGLLFRLPLASALRTGLLLAQGGEFGFVAFGLAERLGLLDPAQAKILVTAVALSMAATPALASLGTTVAQRIEDRNKRKEKDRIIEQESASAADGTPFPGPNAPPSSAYDDDGVVNGTSTSGLGGLGTGTGTGGGPLGSSKQQQQQKGTTASWTALTDDDADSGVLNAAAQNLLQQSLTDSGTLPDVVVCGYGELGKVVCELLDYKLHKYVVVEKNQTKAVKASDDGRPVFYGDLSQPDVLDRFAVADARLVVLTIAQDPASTNELIAALETLKKENNHQGEDDGGKSGDDSSGKSGDDSSSSSKKKTQKPLVIARACNEDHLRELLDRGVKAYLPAISDDSRLLSLPFAGYVLQRCGVDEVDIDYIIENARQQTLGYFDVAYDDTSASQGGTQTKKNKETEEDQPSLDKLSTTVVQGYDDYFDDKDIIANDDDIVENARPTDQGLAGGLQETDLEREDPDALDDFLQELDDEKQQGAHDDQESDLTLSSEDSDENGKKTTTGEAA